tara:strand:- start:303 stop:647 length:345 start_codon:yes stop_codon:yes gene_type:complete
MTEYKIKYLKYKLKYLELKNKNNQKGGAGVPIKISNGFDFFMLSSYSDMMKINDFLDQTNSEGKKPYFYMDNTKKMINKYATGHSDFNARPLIIVSPKEYKVLLFILKKLKISI